MQQKSEPLQSLSRFYTTYGPEETGAVARKIASLVRVRDVILLKGDLGAGKSTFARAFIHSLCGKEVDVPSPTFTLVQIYEAPTFLLWHFDLYRIHHPFEAHELGIEDAYNEGVSLIEWPERLGAHLPKDYLEIELRYGKHENERILILKGWRDRIP